MKRIINHQYGLYGIGGTDGIKLRIEFAGKCMKEWKSFYGSNPPWKKWFINPIFQNHSGYDDVLGRYRIFFIFMWFIVTY